MTANSLVGIRIGCYPNISLERNMVNYFFSYLKAGIQTQILTPKVVRLARFVQ
jgi:hypothetical protein